MFHSQTKAQTPKPPHSHTQTVLMVGHTVAGDQTKTLPQTPLVGSSAHPGARAENEGMALTFKR